MSSTYELRLISIMWIFSIHLLLNANEIMMLLLSTHMKNWLYVCYSLKHPIIIFVIHQMCYIIY